MIPAEFRGRARRLDDIDLPKLGARLGVGEDEIHAVLDVESRGSGFDGKGRPAMLFEPHLFWRELGPGPRRAMAAQQGLAYVKWQAGKYPADSYPRLIKAMAIDETAALRSASWGLGQVLGSHHELLGYPTVQAMVAAFCADEEAHLAGMVAFIKGNHLDDELRRHDWATFARFYNGPGYAANRYDVRLAAAYRKWRGIKDTPWTPASAAAETAENDRVIARIEAEAKASAKVAPGELPAPSPVPLPSPAPATDQGFFSRFFSALKRRLSA